MDGGKCWKWERGRKKGDGNILNLWMEGDEEREGENKEEDVRALALD